MCQLLQVVFRRATLKTVFTSVEFIHKSGGSYSFDVILPLYFAQGLLLALSSGITLGRARHMGANPG